MIAAALLFALATAAPEGTAAPSPPPPEVMAAASARIERTERSLCPAPLAAYERYDRTHAPGSAIAVDRAVIAALPCARAQDGMVRARLLYGLADIELALASVHDTDPNVALPEARAWLHEALPLAGSDEGLVFLIRDTLRTLQ
jgi:hypothetical protein